MLLTITPQAEAQLDAIFDYGLEQWGFERAMRYADAITAAFQLIADREVIWRRLPGDFGVQGFRLKSGRHYI